MAKQEYFILVLHRTCRRGERSPGSFTSLRPANTSNFDHARVIETVTFAGWWSMHIALNVVMKVVIIHTDIDLVKQLLIAVFLLKCHQKDTFPIHVPKHFMLYALRPHTQSEGSCL